MKKRTMRLLGMLMVLILTMSACGTNEEVKEENVTKETEAKVEEKKTEEQDESKEGASEEVVEASEFVVSDEPLSIVVGQSDDQLENEMHIFNKYTEVSGQEFEIIQVPYADLEKKITTMILGNEAPAILRGTEIHAVKLRDYFIPLDYDDSTLVPRIFYNTEGEKISLPTELTAVGVFINTDLADKYGVNYPTSPDDVWTWDEFEVEMEKFMGNEDVDYPAIIDGSAHRFSPWIYQHGGLTYNGSFEDLGWDDQPAIDALERMVRLSDAGIFDSQTYASNTHGEGLFATGRYPVHFSGSWMIKKYHEDMDFNVAVSFMPSGDGGQASVLGGSNYMACQNSGQEEAALSFINWLAKPENLKFAGEVTGQLTAVTTVPVEYGELTPYFDMFSEQLQATDPAYIEDFAQYVRVPGAFSYSKDAIIEALGHLKTPEEALRDATILLQESAVEAELLD